MSSFKNKIKTSLHACVHCKFPYTPATQPNRGARCPRCHLWQPHAAPHLVTYSNQWVPNQLKKIFVINLDRARDRWATFTTRVLNPNSGITSGGRTWHRFPGIDGADHTLIDVAMDNLFATGDSSNSEENKSLDEARVRAKEFWNKRPGSVGCYLTHLSLWNHIYHTADPNEEFVLIMEDDAYLTPFALRNLEIALVQAEKNKPWDLLYAGHYMLKGVQVHPLFVRPKVQIQGEKLTGFNSGFWGYVIRVASIPRLVSIVQHFETGFVDDVVRRHFGRDIHALFLVNELIRQDSRQDSTRKLVDIRPTR